MELQVGVKVFLKNRNGKFLLLKRSPLKYQSVSGFWDIPGGRITPDSPLLENLRREVKEETELEIISEPRLISAQDILPKQKEHHIVRLTYTADTNGEPVLDMGENVEYKWVTIEEMRAEKDLDTYVREILGKI